MSGKALLFACCALVLGMAAGLRAELRPEELPSWHEAPADYLGKIQWGLRGDRKKADECPELKPFLAELPDNPAVLKITGIIPGGTGEAEGLKAGDIILYVNGGPGGGEIPSVDDLAMRVWSPGDGDGTIRDLNVHYANYYHTARDKYQDADGAGEFQAFIPDWWPQLCGILQEKNLAADLQDTLQRLVNVDTLPDCYRMPLYRYLTRNPFKIEAVADSAIGRLRWTGGAADAAGYLPPLLRAADYLRQFAEPAALADAPSMAGDFTTLDEAMDRIEAILARAGELQKQAFTAISQEEQAFVLANRERLLASFVRHHMISYEPDIQAIRDYVRLLETMAKTDYRPLYAQAALAASLASRPFLDKLVRVAGPRLGEPIIASRETPYGRIIIAGIGDNRHWDNAAVLFDLGGDDLYLNNQGASVPGAIPTAVLIDVSGNDRYDNTDNFSQGCGDFGVGLLIDCAGDDQYTGIQTVQGACFGGIGILADEGGNDTYRAIYCSQGFALFGAAILRDQAGNDRYEGHMATQAVGSTCGVGILDDLSGDDSYYCKGSHQTSYQTRGHFEGWGQGIGVGFRPYASGGVGLLADWSGRDRMEGGTFTQGGGYYYGVGMLFNGGHDDDFYLGTRYAQGFCAHQAVGIFVEEGGNDTYRSTHCVTQGLSWDETVVLFDERGGNDDYLPGDGGFSLGATAHNAICIFRDHGGRDTYGAVKPALNAGNSYHGGTCQGLFLDEGGADDAYLGRQNNAVEIEHGHNVFIDK